MGRLGKYRFLAHAAFLVSFASMRLVLHRSQAFAPSCYSRCCVLSRRRCPLSLNSPLSVSGFDTTNSNCTDQSPSVQQDSPIKRHPPKKLSKWAGVMFVFESVRGRHHHYMNHLRKIHGENYMIWNKYVVLHDVDAIRDVLETHNLEKTAEVKRGFRSLFYRRGGLIAAPWKRWLKERRMLAPALAERTIGELAPKFLLGAEPILKLVDKASLSGEILEMDRVFTAMTLDTIGLILLGRTFRMGEQLLAGDTSIPPFSRAIRWVSREAIRQMIVPRSLLLLLPPGRKIVRSQKIIDDFLEECIEERLRERALTENATASSTDLMNILLDAEAAGDMSRENVKGQLFLFLFAGHDTTAHTLTWLLYEVSMNDELQEALHSEAKAALPERYDFCMDPSVLQNNLPLLDAVWKESNRYHPAAATGTTRRVGNKPLVVGKDGLELPARVSVSIPPYSLHRNEKYWDNPEEFDPSRFLDPEKVEKRDPMAFQAFSAGPRNCIGARLARAEALTVASALFRRYRIRNVERRHPPRDYMSLTMRPKNGIRFQFEPLD